jgi:glycosyltransferase involved in cell wall biosynthesis
MRVSIITDVLNAKDTIEETILSVLEQNYPEIEYIIVDGASCDGTLEIIRRYQDRISKIISEKDRNHFEAMNKGLKVASGEVIGFLHADDVFAHSDVVTKIVSAFKMSGADCVWADLVYVSNKNPERVIRYWKSSPYRAGAFRLGWMPAHPTFFVRKWVYEKYGYFNLDLPISADYELMLRFLHKHNISGYYIPEMLVKMRLGGLSNRSFKNFFQKSMEDYRAWKINRLHIGWEVIILKMLIKLPQFLPIFVHLVGGTKNKLENLSTS